MNEREMFLCLDYYSVLNKNAEEGTLEKNVSIAIEYILDLYNKEKQKNEEAKDFINKLQETINIKYWRV